MQKLWLLAAYNVDVILVRRQRKLHRSCPYLPC